MVFQFRDGLQQGAFGIANTISSTLNAVLLWQALRRREELAPIAWPGLRKQLLMTMGLAWMAGLVAWGVGLGYSDEVGKNAEISARLLMVFGPLFSAGIFYWAISGLAGVDSAKAILGIFRRKGS